MTPRGEISWVDANLGADEIREQLLSSPHSLFPVCRGELDEIIGIVRAQGNLVNICTPTMKRYRGIRCRGHSLRGNRCRNPLMSCFMKVYTAA